MRCYRDDRVLDVGGLELGARPRAIAVVPGTEEGPELAALAVAQGADLVEVRLDRIPEPTPERAVERVDAIRAAAPVPLIGTLRLPGQRGFFDGDERRRLAIYEAIAPRVALVDVELNALEIRDRVREACERGGATLLVSFHDTVQTPAPEALAALAREAVEEVGARVFKMCALAADPIDMARLLSFAQSFRDRYADAQIVAMSLGAVGAPSRLLGPVFGSCMTYGYVEGGAPAVQGQLSIPELKRAWGAADERDERSDRAAARLADALGPDAARRSFQLRR